MVNSQGSNSSFTLVILHIQDIEEDSQFMLSYHVITICYWIIYTVLCQTISIIGVFTNIINIVCFMKQGFKDSVNVSLLGLAISDLGCLLTMIIESLSFTPALSEAELPFDPIEISYLTGGIPHTTFTRITGCMTAIITLERCLCITAPLKVKSIVTPKRLSITIACVFIVLIASVAPVYVVNRLEEKFYPERNKSLIGLTFTKDRETVDKFSYAINNIFIPYSSFVVILVCTVILVVKLRINTEWRKASANTTQGDTISNRNQKVAKMVVLISTLFIACFVPISIIFIAMCFEPEFSVYGKYKDLLCVIGGIGFMLESINSSANIFIYYHMSTNYRCIFRTIFRLDVGIVVKQASVHKI